MAAVNGTGFSTSFCAHCERDIPSSNYDLHSAHCKRNLERCRECQEMVPRMRADEHYNEYHAPAVCRLCGTKVSREHLSVHEQENCPRRMVECQYCDFPVEAAYLSAHSDVCGSRTEMCIPCGKYVRLREKNVHDVQFHGESGEAGISTREYNLPRSSGSSAVPADVSHRALPGSRGPPPVASRHRLMFTFAITGVAILIGFFKLRSQYGRKGR
ncbi:hypothetical protein MPTK1_3g13880 [Marchantia polymorpha subsp. ruderalis]|uniref:TRAF-type domain-containing protein n=2 Tax=Marchantia polymorpha TaxID=3197 RepID=A0AAF6B0J3_MARPO|nr:hypothetical protein MARPO_0004s0283 [Marchantia polymorpha]BBN05527.1 hypothetical protein Mp_3g13880 [Marchantia polymorpha subsp. ruderalis]|eukprot:PTQ49060.1 hypothetical protein MARPO_0004s0283 [Marchantia polymorpha]